MEYSKKVYIISSTYIPDIPNASFRNGMGRRRAPAKEKVGWVLFFSFFLPTRLVTKETKMTKSNNKQTQTETKPALLSSSSGVLRRALVEAGNGETKGKTRAELLALARESGLVRSGVSVVPSSFKAKYAENGGNNGDELASVLASTTTGANGLDLDALHAVMAQNGIEPTRWAHLNNGQQRMNVSNVLRGKVRRGERVTIGTTSWN